MVSDSEEAQQTRQKTIDAWVSWINEELGIEASSDDGGNGNGDGSSGSNDE